MALGRRGWSFAAVGAGLVALAVVIALASNRGDDPDPAPTGAEAATDTAIAAGSRDPSGELGATGGAGAESDGLVANAGTSTTGAAGERVAVSGGDAGVSPGRGPTPPVAVELGQSPGGATSGARLGQARYLLDQQRERLPRIEQAIVDAERAGDAERARIERERLAIARSRIAELEAHASELETVAREDGTLADAEREGPRPVGVGNRPEQAAGQP